MNWMRIRITSGIGAEIGITVAAAGLPLAFLLAIAAGTARAQTATALAEAQVLTAEDAYAKAVVARDRAGLVAALADRFVYIHANGLAQDHDDYLRGAAAGLPAQIAGIAFAERHVEIDDHTAYVHGVVVYKVGQNRRARYISIWRRAGDRWQLAVWQNTAWPDDAAAPQPVAR